MESYINHHVHTTGSDGELSPEEVIQQAINLGLKYICITDHYPYPPWMDDPVGKNFHSEEYYEEMRQSLEKYKDRIEIGFGVEMDYFPESKEWIQEEIKRRNWDFVLGSIHDKAYEMLNKKEDLSKEEIKNLIIEYYKELKNLVKSDIFDCVAHLDLVKIENKDSTYFSEEEDWYRKSVRDVLDEIEKRDICVEINTSALRKDAREQHPSEWIMKEIKERNIPITIGSDAHELSHLDHGLKDALELVKKLGFDYIAKFKARKMSKILL